MSVLGYTTGVFDLFHVGHLRLLKRASAQCDHLTVGITSDELCVSRKKMAPVIPLAERMELVAALACVDAVVVQQDMDKFAAWQAHGFHKMFVGDDWKGHPDWVALEQRFAPVGVEIVYFSYTEHTSSSRLRLVLDKIAQTGSSQNSA